MHKFVVCLDNSAYPMSLEQRKLYEVLPDSQAEARGQLRVIDESGEDYLFPEGLFSDVAVSEQVAERMARLA